MIWCIVGLKPFTLLWPSPLLSICTALLTSTSLYLSLRKLSFLFDLFQISYPLCSSPSGFLRNDPKKKKNRVFDAQNQSFCSVISVFFCSAPIWVFETGFPEMTIEEIRGSLGGEKGNIDKFPVGMRVLAVDDDPTCLMLLDGLLRKCQYQVTTTSQARTALKMLRENRNRFDLIISDVHMPDMDGFKLLELVGLEMDLPVIMLSANSDAKLVMKGITHGACDYLVKPVRIEELRNIWQHVIRKKKVESKNQNKSTTRDKTQHGSEDGDALTSSADQNGKLNRKRKDEEEEGEDNGNESDDPSSQKKPRVVWSIELHRKFVGAVNQLGIEKAVPKRILDMMNVEGLTRENVASHLQKYRLYLKRISSVATQQANMVAALGGKDSSYIRIGSLDGLGDYRTLAGSGRIPNTSLSSYPQSGMLGRLNTPAGVNLRSLTSSPLIQPSHAQNSGHSINNIGKFQPIVSPINQNASLFQGVPTSLDLGQLQQSKGSTTHFGELNSYGAATNPMVLQGTPQQMQSGGGFGNQSSFNLASLKSEPLAIGFHDSSDLLDHGRCNENWDSAVQLSKFSSNSLPLSESFNHNQLPTNRLQENNSSIVPFIQNGPLEFSSTSIVSAPLADARGAIQCRAGLVGDFVPSGNQRWGEHKQDQTHNSTNIFSQLNSIVPASGRVGPFSQNLDQLDGVCNRKMDVSLVGQSHGGSSILVQHGDVEKSAVDLKIRSSEDYLLEQMKLQGGFVPNNYDSLDDLVNAMAKRDQEGTMLMDGGEFGFDNYSFGSCI